VEAEFESGYLLQGALEDAGISPGNIGKDRGEGLRGYRIAGPYEIIAAVIGRTQDDVVSSQRAEARCQMSGADSRAVGTDENN